MGSSFGASPILCLQVDGSSSSGAALHVYKTIARIRICNHSTALQLVASIERLMTMSAAIRALAGAQDSNVVKVVAADTK